MFTRVCAIAGKFPLLTVTTVMSIARQAEAVFDHTQHFDHLMNVRPSSESYSTYVCLQIAQLDTHQK